MLDKYIIKMCLHKKATMVAVAMAVGYRGSQVGIMCSARPLVSCMHRPEFDALQHRLFPIASLPGRLLLLPRYRVNKSRHHVPAPHDHVSGEGDTKNLMFCLCYIQATAQIHRVKERSSLPL